MLLNLKTVYIAQAHESLLCFKKSRVFLPFSYLGLKQKSFLRKGFLQHDGYEHKTKLQLCLPVFLVK